MRHQTIVLGAGIVGVSSALHLQAAGRQVTLLDRAAPGLGTSYGNAGLIERSSVVPYAFPRSPLSLCRYGLNRRSDVRYNWRELPRLAPWLWRYWQASAPRPLRQATQAMQPLIQRCVIEHDVLASAAGLSHLLTASGWIEVFRSTRALLDAETEALRQLEYNLDYRVLSPADLREREPGIGAVAVGAIHWLDPKTVSDPGALTQGYFNLFRQRGGHFEQALATRLEPATPGWKVHTGQKVLIADEVVIALGPQANDLLSPLGYALPLQSKRGYHLHYAQVPGAELRHALCDSQAGYVLAPMARGIRLTTGIEFDADHAPANEIQLRRCEALARRLHPLGRRLDDEPWLGLRPCLPDMRPALGAVGGHPGLWLNVGHAHHGLTLGPVCGRLLAQLMSGQRPLTDPAAFSPRRFE